MKSVFARTSNLLTFECHRTTMNQSKTLTYPMHQYVRFILHFKDPPPHRKHRLENTEGRIKQWHRMLKLHTTNNTGTK